MKKISKEFTAIGLLEDLVVAYSNELKAMRTPKDKEWAKTRLEVAQYIRSRLILRRDNVLRKALASDLVQAEAEYCSAFARPDKDMPHTGDALKVLARGIYADDKGVATDYFGGALAAFGRPKHSIDIK